MPSMSIISTNYIICYRKTLLFVIDKYLYEYLIVPNLQQHNSLKLSFLNIFFRSFNPNHDYDDSTEVH